jgi:putative (di)nucleoside polyphosphate hydrolase
MPRSAPGRRPAAISGDLDKQSEPWPTSGDGRVKPGHDDSGLVMPRFEDLPYRPCVGVMVLNRAGLVFVGRRIDGPEHTDPTHVWQLPQGGVDPGEDTWDAARRELHEETNIRSVKKLGEIPEWLSYDIPRELVGEAWNGKYRGQKQKWYALRFTGDDAEIDIAHPAGGHEPEFIAWRWEPMENLPMLVVPFKRPVYERVVEEFARLAYCVPDAAPAPTAACKARSCDSRCSSLSLVAPSLASATSSSVVLICVVSSPTSKSSIGVAVSARIVSPLALTSANPPTTTMRRFSPPLWTVTMPGLMVAT